MYDKLFKGIRLDNGQWVEGYLVKGERTYLITKNAIDYMVVSTSYMASVEMVEIDPGSLSESTNLPDKNNNMIFVNDIIRWTDWKKNQYERPVVYDQNLNRFSVFVSKNETFGVNKWLGNDIEIVGNLCQ